MPPHLNLPPFRPEIVATGCYLCPAGTICACQPPPTDLYCSTSTCRHYIPPRSIKSTIASCHTCFTATCTLCRGPYHSPSPDCPAEHTVSGIIFTIRAAYLEDVADIDRKEAALHRVYGEAVRENQSITWQCAHLIGERLLRNHRARLDAERVRVREWIHNLRQERLGRYIRDMEAAMNEENETLLAQEANTAHAPEDGGN